VSDGEGLSGVPALDMLANAVRNAPVPCPRDFGESLRL